VTVDAPPERIWPWLVQMGRGRGGFYSIDLIDNGGARSARELDPARADLRAGDVLPADARGNGFEVLDLEPGRALVLGGLYDAAAGRQVPFRDPRPDRYWHVTWAFALENLVGCGVRDAERIHPEWQARAGDHLVLHPSGPPFEIVPRARA
jgi:hypothetical protein